MSTYLEELATLAAKIGDDNAKAALDLGWIGPQERDALVDAAQQARKQLAKAPRRPRAAPDDREHAQRWRCNVSAFMAATKMADFRADRSGERTMVDGRLVHPYAKHGTYSTYSNYCCRCELCTAANATYVAEKRSRVRAKKVAA